MKIKLDIELPACWRTEVDIAAVRWRDVKEWQVQNDKFMYKLGNDISWREVQLCLTANNRHNMTPLAVCIRNSRGEHVAQRREK
jgi:hypothetical protein